MAVPPGRRRFKTALALAAIGVALAVAGVALVYPVTFPGVTIRRVGFSTESYSPHPIEVSGLLITPSNPPRSPLPGVVFSHGLLLSKEAYLAQCRALSRSGFAVLAIDHAGHGESGGANDAGIGEKYVVWAACDVLAQTRGVDPDRIAAAGHSLGGMASTTAGIFQKGNRIKAVVAIGCQPGRKQAAESAFGPAEEFLGRLWPFTAFSRRFDINDPEDLEARDVISHVKPGSPPDFMVIIGNRDTLETVVEASSVVAKAAGRARVAPGRTYGDFDNGTACRLEVTGDTHVSEAFSSEAWTALRNWLLECFVLRVPSGTLRTGALQRYAGQGLLVLGYLLLGLALLFLLLGTLEKPQRPDSVLPYDPGKRVALWLAIVSLVLFAATSIAALPFAKLTGMRAFVPFLGADVAAALALARTLLLIPAFLLVLGLMKAKGWKPLGVRGSLPTGYQATRSVLLGAGPFVVFALLYTPSARRLLLSRGTPSSTWGFFAFAAVLLVSLVAEQEFLHYFFMPAFGPDASRGRGALYVLVESAVRGVCLGLALVPIVANPFYLVGRAGGMRVPLVPTLMLAGFFIYLPASALSYFSRRRGYGVLAPCLCLSLFVSLLFACFVSTRAL